jgi:hypothetical protein
VRLETQILILICVYIGAYGVIALYHEYMDGKYNGKRKD